MTLQRTIQLNGSELFTLAEDRSRTGAFSEATVSIKYTPSEVVRAAWGVNGYSGPGVYGCFWRGNLFYVGTFAGKEGDLQKGNVAAERWRKHIEGMTFRSRRIGIASSRLRLIEMGHRSPLAQLLCSGDREKLCRKNGNGIQVQYNKFLFADKNWQDFSQLDQNMMKLFDFVYVRPDLHAVFRGMNKSEVDPHLRDVEKHAIKRLCPSCNSARPVGSISNLCISFDEVIEEIETLLTGQIKILHEKMKIVCKL